MRVPDHFKSFVKLTGRLDRRSQRTAMPSLAAWAFLQIRVMSWTSRRPSATPKLRSLGMPAYSIMFADRREFWGAFGTNLTPIFL